MRNFDFRWALRGSLAVALLVLAASCVSPDTKHHVVVSVPEQRLAVLEEGA